MTGKEKVLATARQKKVFRAADVDGVPRNQTPRYLARLVADGALERVGYGLYSLTDDGDGSDFTEHQTFLEVAARVPAGVLCLLSALRFHNLTTQNPFEVWLAVPRDAHMPKIQTAKTRVFRFAPKVYEAGVETHVIAGVEVKVYSAAKTVADCFYFQREVGFDIALEALREAWRARKATMDELYHFAEVRRIKGVMIPYLNTLG